MLQNRGEVASLDRMRGVGIACPTAEQAAGIALRGGGGDREGRSNEAGKGGLYDPAHAWQ